MDYGSYVYHSHSRGQLIDGLYGAIYIEPNRSVERPFKLITDDPTDRTGMAIAESNTEPLILSDWRLLTSEAIWKAELDSGCECICSSAILINGKGSSYCLPQQRLNDLAVPGQRALLGNHTLTDIGWACLLNPLYSKLTLAIVAFLQSILFLGHILAIPICYPKALTMDVFLAMGQKKLSGLIHPILGISAGILLAWLARRLSFSP